MSGARILIIDDERQLRRAVRLSLVGHGYTVREAEDGADALKQFEAFRPDAVLLDLMLPDMSGIEVCRELRRTYDTPIVVLSVVGDERSKVAALDAGADDYLTKPFGIEELLARVRVALRRGSATRTQRPIIRIQDLSIDLEHRSVALAGSQVRLTPTEYSLLKFLALNAGKVLTHRMILGAVWGAEYAEDNHVLRTYVNQLRAKLREDSADPRFIRTEAGVGYRFIDVDSIS